jgi:hypothetical protein
MWAEGNMSSGQPTELPALLGRSPLSEFRVEIEEGFQAGLQLLLDFFLAAFEHVHCDVGFASVLELESCVADFGDFFGWQQAHAIDECQVCHALILNPTADLGRRTSGFRPRTPDLGAQHPVPRARDDFRGGGRDAPGRRRDAGAILLRSDV